MADQACLICWDITDAFAIGIQLMTPDGCLYTESEQLVDLDTGYDGELLVPYDLYVSLGLRDWEFPKELWSTGLTVSGESLSMALSRAFVVIPRLGQQYQVLVDTFEGNTEFLIGRAFMREHKILLDGPAGRVCLVTEEDE